MGASSGSPPRSTTALTDDLDAVTLSRTTRLRALAPRFLLRDRHTIDGSDLRRAAQAMGIEDVLTAPRSPWQNLFVEPVIGSLRRECLDHVIVWNERALRR